MVKQHAYKPKRQYIPKKKKKLFSPAILVALFFGVLMVTSTVGIIGAYYGDQSGGGNLVYEDHTFVRTQRGYSTNIDGTVLEFSYFPDTLVHMNISPEVVSTLKDKEAIVVTYNPETPINQSVGLIQYNLEQVYDKALDSFAQRALTNNTDFPSLSQIDCADATPFVPVLRWEHGNESRFYQEGSCVRAIARSDIDAIRMHDRLVYSLIGVMD